MFLFIYYFFCEEKKQHLRYIFSNLENYILIIFFIVQGLWGVIFLCDLLVCSFVFAFDINSWDVFQLLDFKYPAI